MYERGREREKEIKRDNGRGEMEGGERERSFFRDRDSKNICRETALLVCTCMRGAERERKR